MNPENEKRFDEKDELQPIKIKTPWTELGMEIFYLYWQYKTLHIDSRSTEHWNDIAQKFHKHSIIVMGTALLNDYP